MTGTRPDDRRHSAAPWVLAAALVATVAATWWFGRGAAELETVTIPDPDPIEPVVQAPIPGAALSELMPGVTGSLAVVVAEEAGETINYRLLLWPADAAEPEVIGLPTGFGTLWPDPTGRFVAFGVADPEILAGYATYRFDLHVGAPGGTAPIAAGVESVAWSHDGELGWTSRSDDGVVSVWRVPDAADPRPEIAVEAAERGTRLRSMTASGFWLRSPDDSLSLLDAVGRTRHSWSGYHDARAMSAGHAALVGGPDGAVLGWWDGAALREVNLASPPGGLLRVELATGPAPAGRAALWIATTTSTSVLVVSRDGEDRIEVGLDGQLSSMHWSPDGRSLMLAARIGDDDAALRLDLDAGTMFGVAFPGPVVAAWLTR